MTLVGGHLTRLFDFSGRENRQPFWLWVLVVYGVQTVLSFLLTVPFSVVMSTRMQALGRYDQEYLDVHPEVASRIVMDAMSPMFTGLLVFSAVLALVTLLLLAAAVTRRLHDSGRSGWWGAPVALLQLATLAGYAIMLPRFFREIAAMGPNASPEAVSALMAAIVPVVALTMLAGLVGFVLMILLVVFLAQRGTIGPNRYGDDLLPPPAAPIYPVHPQYYPPTSYRPPAPPAPPPPARVVQGPPPA